MHVLPVAPALIFDVGGVILDWNPHYLFDELIADPVKRTQFLTEVCPPAWNAELDRGQRLETAVAERCRQYPDWARYIHAYQQHWVKMLGGMLPGMHQLLGELADSGARLYGLTNWSAETFPIARAAFPILDLFANTIVISGEVGLTKPDPAIFHLALARFGLDPAECLFIDDNPANVSTARHLGMPAVLFAGAQALCEHPGIARYLVTSAASVSPAS
ncbi:MAG: HAD family phosphatase [Pseudonocardia sp.]|nr:HAD family phosphatase [Pseudonocardia sp.]